jgi:dTMP kinase
MLIAIEGLDGAGKLTQSRLLRERVILDDVHTAKVISFPRYGNTLFAKLIADYLNGKFGGLKDVSAYFVAMLFAGDRLQKREVLLHAMAKYDVVICDRYVASNMAYQGARVQPRERWSFISWVSQLEYKVYRLPKADLTVYLRMSVDATQRNVLKKGVRCYTNLKADVHERSNELLRSCQGVYDQLARRNAQSRWIRVDCEEHSGGVRAKADIANEVWRQLRRTLNL